MNEEQEMTGDIASKEALIDAYSEFECHIGKACRKAKVGRRTFYNWKKSDPVFAERIKEIDEEEIDESENQMRLLRKGIPRYDKNGKLVGWKVKPHFGALLKYLEAKAKDRGWGTSVVLNGEYEDIEGMSQEEISEKALRLARELEKFEEGDEEN